MNRAANVRAIWLISSLIFALFTFAGCGDMVTATSNLNNATAELKAAAKEIKDATINPGQNALGIKDKDDKIAALQGQNTQIEADLKRAMEALAQKDDAAIPYAVVGQYKDANNKKASVEHVNGLQFKFTNERGGGDIYTYDPKTKLFSNKVGYSAYYFQKTGKLAFEAQSGDWQK